MIARAYAVFSFIKGNMRLAIGKASADKGRVLDIKPVVRFEHTPAHIAASRLQKCIPLCFVKKENGDIAEIKAVTDDLHCRREKLA